MKSYINLFLFFIGTTTITAAAQLEQDDFLLTHKTNVFPRNGIMVPGLCFADKEGKPVNTDEAPNLRLTLHWYGMGMHKAHNNNKNTQKYLLIEQGNTCIERLQCGYHEDFMMVGPHLLSPSSLALVPDTELQGLQANNPYFKGKWLSYNAEEESLEQASQKIIHNMGKPNVKVVEETIEKKLNLSQLFQVQAMISQNPHLSELLQKREDGWYLVEEPNPQQLRLDVNGNIVTAYQYYDSVLPSTFKWCAHEDTDYNLLEAYGSRLFTPLLNLQSPQPTHLQLSKTDLVNTAKEFLKAYQSVVKENLQSHSYSQLLKEYMDAWKANIKIWYNFVVEQGKELNNKPYEETLFGNTQRLKKAISANQTSLIKLDLNKYATMP